MTKSNEMKLIFFNRNPQAGFSIAKVFNTIKPGIRKQVDFEDYDVPERRAGLWSVVKNIFFVIKHRNSKAVHHVTGDIHYTLIGLIGCKTVLTVHDTSSLDFPKNPIKRLLIKWLWYKIPLAIADKVICISDHTKIQLSRLTNRKDLLVIPNAVDQMFSYKPKNFNTNQPVILQVGTAWNKNLINVVKALEPMNIKFIIVGQLNDEQQAVVKSSGLLIELKENLSDLQLLELYESCDIISFCSVYEGFGMPIIEGNAVGRCVVTSSISPMLEIAHNAALFADPYDVQSIRNCFSQLIQDSELKVELIKNGLENVERFQPEAVVAAYMNLYLEIAKR